MLLHIALILVPCALAQEMECFNFGAFPAGEPFVGSEFHPATKSFGSLDERAFLQVVHEGKNPTAWVGAIPGGSSTSIKNSCAGANGALSFLSDVNDDRKTMGKWIKGLKIQYKEGNFIERFRVSLADLGDWDAWKWLKASNGNEGVLKVCGYATWDAPDAEAVACGEMITSTVGNINDGCTRLNSAEVSSSIGNMMEIRITFSIRKKDTQALVRNYAFDPNFGITELCWPGARTMYVVSEDAAPAVHSTPVVSDAFGSGFFNVTLTRRPLGTTVVTVVPPEGVEISRCTVFLDRHNYDSGEIVKVTGQGQVRLEAINADDDRFEGLLTIVTVPETPSPIGAPATCSGWGDPHFTTFDGQKHNNYLPGDHYWVKSEDSRLTIQARQVKCKKAACTTAIVAKYKQTVVAVGITDTDTIRATVLSESTADISIVKKSDILYHLKLQDGGRIEIKLGMSKMLGEMILKWTNIKLSADYRGKVSGLCGNFNGDKTDEPISVPTRAQKRSGNANWMTASSSQFSVVPSSENLFNYPAGDVPFVEAVPTGFKACNVEIDPDDVTDIVEETGKILPPTFKEPDLTPFVPPDCEEDPEDSPCNIFDVLAANLDIDVTPFKEACIEDLCVIGDPGFITDSIQSLLATHDSVPDVATEVQDVFECTLNCNYQGTCVEGTCVCDQGFTGATCEDVAVTGPLVISTDSEYSLTSEPSKFVLVVENQTPETPATCVFELVGANFQVARTETVAAEVVSTGLTVCTVSSTSDSSGIKITLKEGSRTSNQIVIRDYVAHVFYVVNCNTGHAFQCEANSGDCYHSAYGEGWQPMSFKASALYGLSANDELIFQVHGENTASESVDYGATVQPNDYNPQQSAPLKSLAVDEVLTTTFNIDTSEYDGTCVDGEWTPGYENPDVNIANCEIDGVWQMGQLGQNVYWCKGFANTCAALSADDRLTASPDTSRIARADLPEDLEMIHSHAQFGGWEEPIARFETTDGYKYVADNSGVHLSKSGFTFDLPWCCHCLENV